MLGPEQLLLSFNPFSASVENVATRTHTWSVVVQEEASKAKRRIVLSSLYLGTGELEQQFVSTGLKTENSLRSDVVVRLFL